MSKAELDQWYRLQNEYANNPEEMDNWTHMELVRLNHLVMALAHNVHNDNMMGGIDCMSTNRSPLDLMYAMSEPLM